MIGNGCFATGTRFRVVTPVGVQERPIEALRPGEQVMTATGPAPVAAIAPCDPPEGPGAAIQLQPNAIAPGQPAAPLLVAPEQLVFIRDDQWPEGALAPAGALVNGRAILRAARPGGVVWYALSLESQGLPLAAGLPLASHRAPGGTLAAELVPPGPRLFALRGRLGRAAATAAAAADPAQTAPASEPPPGSPEAPPEPAFVDDLPPGEAPDLRLLADGRALAAEQVEGGTWQFRIPARARALRLLSPVGVPPNRPEGDSDGRRFGVAIQSVLLDGIPLDLGGPVAGEGFYELETREHHRWRWTNGNARLVLPPCHLPRSLTVSISDWHRLLRRQA